MNSSTILNFINPGINIERVDNLFLRGKDSLQSNGLNESLQFVRETHSDSFERNISEITEQASFLYEDLGFKGHLLDDQKYDQEM